MKFLIALVVATLGAIAIYQGVFREAKIESAELEIHGVLESLFKSEQAFFKDQKRYTDEIGDFYLETTKSPTVYGAYPDCNDATNEIPHMFVGSVSEDFKIQARAALESAKLSGQCSKLQSEFTVFAAQDLDGDSQFELWTMNQAGKTNVISTD